MSREYEVKLKGGRGATGYLKVGNGLRQVTGPPSEPPPPGGYIGPSPGPGLPISRIPWEGGSAYWADFPAAHSSGWSNPAFFPISVWFGTPAGASDYRELGINTFQAAEHEGSIADMTSKGMSVIIQDEWTDNEIGDNRRVVGWLASDECEMGYGACTPPEGMVGVEAEEFEYATQVSLVNTIRNRNDGRFCQANFGNGIMATYWSPNRMDDHVALMDATSVDKYAYTSPHVQSLLIQSPYWTGGNTQASAARAATYGWLVDRLTALQPSGVIRPRWMFVETAMPFLTEEGATTITLDQLEGAVWSAIIHEARGINYFEHNNNGEYGMHSLLVGDQPRKDRVKKVNGHIRYFAPALNSQSYVWDFDAENIDTMLKAYGPNAYIFAGVDLVGNPGQKTFTLPGSITGTEVTVMHEDRTIPVVNGKFTDSFSAEWSHHTYRITI